MSTYNRIKQQSKIVLKSRFLQNLSTLERYEFLQLCHRRSYKEGEYIFYRNDPGTGMYFIEDGSVELTIASNIEESEDDNNASDAFLLHSPDSFGALSIGYNLRRKTSALCKTDCTLLGFFKPDFEVLMERHPQIAVKFLQMLTNIALRQLEKALTTIEQTNDPRIAAKIEFDAYYDEENIS
jgi:CRP/FNR family cyclic AMP-dependent transcriptional regulator